ncbi:hypothetical protein DRW41_16105 [Neobacillus piezotolerans]|uniref:Bulb-type lectin domain-containing protein n=1 Tax=Neobacillus piezotolerans TaxID=2259171 RepID=A0A3D8GMN3_9BACI|nr:hypothetical protein [Neobacillus piezotolerans]RDU35668.1 hypothetical protein DRW41_16105 [Neobacillus piezotolerans]
MKIKISLVIFLIFSIFLAGGTDAASLPDSVVKSWTKPKAKNTANVTLGPNGFKGISTYQEYELVNSKGKTLYKYKSPYINSSVIHKDGLVYLIEENGKVGSKKTYIVSLDVKGKQKWRKEVPTGYAKLALLDQGSLFLNGNDGKNWFIMNIDTKSGKTIWSSKANGYAYYGPSGHVIFGNMEKRYPIYKNNKLVRELTPPEDYYLLRASFSKEGKLAVVFQAHGKLLNTIIVVYDVNGNELFSKQIINPYQTGQILFNEKEQLLITYKDTRNSALTCEWYDSNKMTEKSVIPKATSSAIGFGVENLIISIDNNKNMYYLNLTAPVSVNKYNKSGKLIGKTMIPKNYTWERAPDPDNFKYGLFFIEFKNNYFNKDYHVYSYK